MRSKRRSVQVELCWMKPWSFCFSFLVQVFLVFCLSELCGCGQGQVERPSEEGTLSQPIAGCTVSMVRYPTSESEFARLYADRGFLVDDVHIGRDINLSEGTAIYPIACGTVRVYRAANGYGTLVVVLEHHLASPITVTNGVGERVSVQDFLSIYGHLRSTALRTGGARLAWRDGDTVRPDQIIGYVQNAADNGDGEEHLHLGIRLQTATEAARVDPTAWFAGYDSARTRRRWYADPGSFLPALLRRPSQRSTAVWHPTGSVLNVDGQTWFVVSDGLVTQVPDDVLRDERLDRRVVSALPAEIACMQTAGFSLERTSGHRLVRFEGSSTVYEYADTPSAIRYTFLAQQAFDAWGWTNSQVVTRPVGERAAFLARYRDVGSRHLREGSLVKAAGRGDVYVVSEGRRRPIFDWPTFLALGYDEAWIIEVDASILDVLAGPLGEVIRPEHLTRCVHAPRSMELMDAGVTPVDAGFARDVSAGVDTGIDATVDVGSVRDVPLPMDTPAMDASVSPLDASLPTIDLGRDAGVDATSVSVDVPVMHPETCNNPSLDAGMPDVVTIDTGSPPPPAGVPPVGAVMRYEFRLATDGEGWRPTEPYYLRDHWWERIRCLNGVVSDPLRMIAQGDGWYRCDTSAVHRIFVGTFYSPSHATLGDHGHIPTIDNWPMLCNPRLGVEWRISELPSGRELYRGPSSSLPCTNIGSDSRHQLP